MLIISLTSDEYSLAVENSANRWSNTKRGLYGRGILNSKNDQFKTERIGLLGEIAFAKVFDLQVDFSHKHGGDQFDFCVNEKTIDVKTSSKYPVYEAGLIMRVTENNKEISIDKNYYVFSYLKQEDQSSKTAEIVLVGYQTKEFIEKLPIVPPRLEYLKHKNVEVKYGDLLDLEELNGIFCKKEVYV